MLVFRQLFDPTSSTYTYLLGCSATREALLIDPVFEQARRDAALIEELGLHLKWTLETHVHADHVTGAWLLAQAWPAPPLLLVKAGAGLLAVMANMICMPLVRMRVRATDDARVVALSRQVQLTGLAIPFGLLALIVGIGHLQSS